MDHEELTIYNKSDEVQEIVTAVPSFTLRYGILVVGFVLVVFVFLSTCIRYPEIVKTDLKINSLNAPKPVYAKQTGKLVKILVNDRLEVKKGAALAFMESVGSHDDVIKLHNMLLQFRQSLLQHRDLVAIPSDLNLGELQSSFLSFYSEYLRYVSTLSGGYYEAQRRFLKQDLDTISKIRSLIISQQQTQQEEFLNIEREYNMYKLLYEQKVISKSEFRQQENKYLSSKHPLQQTQTSLVNNSSAYISRRKELLGIDFTIKEEKEKFVQALNSIIKETDLWLSTYVLSAPMDGVVTFAGIVQENQTLTGNQEVFILDPGNTDFFGEIHVPQRNLGKVRKGQSVLVKMYSYPYEQFGLIRGRIDYLSDAAYNDSVFMALVLFDKLGNRNLHHAIKLKNGMLGEAEIVVESSTLFERFIRSINKLKDAY